MGEKFGPDQPAKDQETSVHEQAEVLSPLGAAFLNHLLNRIDDPAKRALAEPHLRRWTAELGREDLDQLLGLREEKRGVMDRLVRNKYFQIGLAAAAGAAFGVMVEASYSFGKKQGERYQADETSEPAPAPDLVPERLTSDISDVDPSELESHEPDYAEFERLDPTLKPELVRRLFSTLPQGFLDEVYSFGYRSTPALLPAKYGVDGTEMAAVMEQEVGHPRSSIFFYPSSASPERLTDVEGWFGIAAHEITHANDHEHSLSMSDADRQKLQFRLNERVTAPNRFHSDYVENIKFSAQVEPDPVRRARRELELKGTEYLAELDENYLMSDDPEKEFAPEDLALIRWFISLKDPNFDQRAARARHFETLREMQQLREDWQQAEAQVAQEEIAARVRDLPVPSDERDFFQRRLSGLMTPVAGDVEAENAGAEAARVEARTFRADLVRALKRWGTTKARRDWADDLLCVYSRIQDLRESLGESDFQRREVLDLAGQLSQDAVDVAKLPEGAALPEAEMFRSEILALFSAHGSLETDLDSGEFEKLLDWDDEAPDWAVRSADFTPAKADLGLAEELFQRRLFSDVPDLDDDKM